MASLSATTRSPQAQCHLFRIPPELRNYIYELILTVCPNDQGTVVINRTDRTAFPEHESRLCILQTCHLINEEAQGIYYSVHHLELRPSPALGFHPHDLVQRTTAFIQCLNEKRRCAITKFTFTANYIEQVTGALKQVHLLTGLEILTLCLENSRHEDPRNFVREMPFWKVAVKKLPPKLKEIKLRLSIPEQARVVVPPKIKAELNQVLERRGVWMNVYY